MLHGGSHRRSRTSRMKMSSGTSPYSTLMNWCCHERPNGTARSTDREASDALDPPARLVLAHHGNDLAGEGHLSLVAGARHRRWQRLDFRAGDHALAGGDGVLCRDRSCRSVGLWLAAAWGGVVWLTASISMAAIELFFPQVYGGRLWVAVTAFCAILIFFRPGLMGGRERPE